MLLIYSILHFVTLPLSCNDHDTFTNNYITLVFYFVTSSVAKSLKGPLRENVYRLSQESEVRPPFWTFDPSPILPSNNGLEGSTPSALLIYSFTCVSTILTPSVLVRELFPVGRG